jgi:acyl carrier protein
MEKLVKMFARVLEVSPEEINDLTSPENVDVWDSLKFMQLVTEFEAEFALTLEVENILKLKSFADFKRLLSEKNALD